MPAKTKSKKVQPLTAESIFSNRTVRMERVKVPEWGRDVWVRELAAADGGVIGNISKTDGLDVASMISTVSKTVCNESGELIFTTKEHREKLGKESFAVIQRLFVKAMDVSATTTDGVEAEKKT